VFHNFALLRLIGAYCTRSSSAK